MRCDQRPGDRKSPQRPYGREERPGSGLSFNRQVASNNLDTNYKQAADANLLLLPAVGFSGLAASAAAVNDLLVKALRSSVAQGQPAHLAITKDLWSFPTTPTGPATRTLP